jgi:hypothetical protein
MITLETLTQIGIVASFALPITIAFTSFAKQFTFIDKRYEPIAALVAGIVTGLLFVGVSVEGALAGVLFGLSSMGLYDFSVKSVANK